MINIFAGNYTRESNHARKSFEHMATEKLVAITGNALILLSNSNVNIILVVM